MSGLRTDLVLTCSCGATLAYSSSYTPYVTQEREAFDQAHAICREKRAAPAGSSPASTVPRLPSPKPTPPPPERAPVLPDPAVPSP